MVFRKPGNSRDDKPSRSTGRSAKSAEGSGSRASSGPRSSSKFNKDFNDSPRRPRTTSEDGERSFSKSADSKSGERSFGRSSGGDRPYKSTGKSFGDKPARKTGDKPFGGKSSDRSFGDKKFGNKSGFGKSEGRSFGNRNSDKPYGEKKFGNKSGFNRSEGESFGNRSSEGRYEKRTENFGRPFKKSYDKPERSRDFDADKKPARTMRAKKSTTTTESKDDGLIRLNRYISNAGICSRRKADELIQAGVVSVNGEVVSELGYKVDPSKDLIRYNGETLKREKMVYVLLNKPKDYITTTDDPQERRTVMQLVDKASKERIYPVGRLDRNTTGLLLMTNDGDLADKLSHPRNSITKIYQVELSKSLTQGDLNKIQFGVELEDGFIKPDAISYVQGGTKREVGIQIHSGRNRIVRRIFEHLGYEVEKLDRSVYANLTKKDLPRGRWRFLDEKEVIQLKNLVK